MRRTVVPVIAVIAVVLTALGPGRASAAAPEISVSGPGTDVPYKVQTHHDAIQPVSFEFKVDLTGSTSDLTVSLDGDGVTAEPAARTVPPGGYANFEVYATPGLHDLTVTVSAEGADPVTRDYQVWAEGAEPIAGGGDLTGRSWMWHGRYSADDRGFEWEDTLWFLDDQWVVTGIPRHGVPTACTAVGRPVGCQRYWYDEASGMVQVGDQAIGLLRPRGLYLDGHGPGTSLEEDAYGSRWYEQRVGFYPARTKPAHTWTWVDGDTYPNRHYVAVTLRLAHNGTFTWRQVTELTDVVVRTGHYTLGARGALSLSGRWGSRVLTIAPCVTKAGALKPRRCLALSFSDPDVGWTGAIMTVPRRQPE